MYEFERELKRQRSQQDFREPGLRPLPLPRPSLRAYVKAYVEAYTPVVLFFLLGVSIAGIVITLVNYYWARLLPYLGDIAIAVVWGTVLIIGVLVVRKTRILRRSKRARPTPRARTHDVPIGQHGGMRYRSPDALPPYPPEQFFSYDPLNKRPSEHLNPDQRNRF